MRTGQIPVREISWRTRAVWLVNNILIAENFNANGVPCLGLKGSPVIPNETCSFLGDHTHRPHGS